MSNTFTARIIASHGRHYVARADNGALWHCIARGKKHEVAVNDLVKLTNLGNSGDVTQPQAVIEQTEPRQNLFRRSDQFKDKAIAANVDQVWFVVATEPSFDPELLSRCHRPVPDAWHPGYSHIHIKRTRYRPAPAADQWSVYGAHRSIRHGQIFSDQCTGARCQSDHR